MKPEKRIKWDERALRRLDNGLAVHIVVRGDPRDADIAVCSSDEEGNRGPLNQLVLNAAGLSPTTLHGRFLPPAMLITDGELPVLVVQTVSHGVSTAPLLRDSLSVGLSLLNSLEGRGTIWLPLLGTGARGISPFKSAQTIIDVLSSAKLEHVKVVYLAAADEKTAELVAADWESTSVPDTSTERISERSQPNRAEERPAPTGLIAFRLIDDGVRDEFVFTVDPPLAAVLTRAIILGERKAHTGPPLSWSSILAGFLASHELDPLGSWLQAYATQAHVDLPKLFARFGIEGAPWLKMHVSEEDVLNRVVKPTRRTTSARQAMTEAERIRDAATGRDAPVSTRHLMAAYTTLYNHDSDLANLRMDRRAWCKAFCREMQRRFPAEAAFWGRFEQATFGGHDTAPDDEGTLPITRRAAKAGFGSDAPAMDDLLGIDNDVRALCSIIAASDADPPISIGLFGDWGTGKTTFMKEMHKWIEALKDRHREQPDATTGFCTNIVQLWFNAWHYIDTSLWANLAEEIFEGLGRAVQNDKSLQDGVAARARLLAAATSARDVLADAERAKASADADKQAVDKNIETLEERQAEIARDLGGKALARSAYRALIKQPEVKENLDKATEALGLPQAKAKATELRTQLAELREHNRVMRAFGAIALSFKNRPGAFAATVAFVAVMIGVAIWGLPLLIPKLSDTFGRTLSGALAAIVTVLGAVLPKMRKVVRFLDDAFKDADETIEKEKQRRKDALAQEQARIAERLKVAEAQREAAERRVLDVERQLASLHVDRRMSEFIRERRESTDYRQHLGVVARARRDFQNLSDLLAKARNASAEDEPEIPDLPRVDRIVLYIDDLDRCPEDKVVDVLQAVHLLLAFPLFIVVVGVDSRWLMHSLKTRLGALRGEDEDEADAGLSDEEQLHWQSTPLNYLEKIFQIPFAVQPMSPKGFGQLVDDLAISKKKAVAPKAKAVIPVGDTTTEPAPPPSPAPLTSVPLDVAAPVPPARPAPVEEAPSAPKAAMTSATATKTATTDPAFDLNPADLQISDDERKFIKRLYRLIPSPRATKRFINIYRLVRVTMLDDESTGFVAEQRYRHPLFLLAILVSHPMEATDILRDLIEEEYPDRWWDFIDGYKKDRLKKAGGDDPIPHIGIAPGPAQALAPDPAKAAEALRWSQLLETLDDLKELLPETTKSADLARWAPRVARYSFESGRVLFTRRNATPAGEPAAPSDAAQGAS